ncbi:cellulase family glycosylhydrolase [Robertkochia solimangrovi]|uniref:cellulase family glycosylhydrolase n=1 Tax=Robertkochia solimangrovi TaxID=2213046 RepID=UPI00117D062B|nr:cellulase family glycosylhydrolase [Robertkochia solimangrovi]TRZ44466.1 glycosyl hydrolase family 5 [Robertkochia solimangrovi]
MKKILLTGMIMILSISLGNAQGFLRTNGEKIVNSSGENIVLRGIGLGGHMLQEGYMLRVPFSGQQYIYRDSLISLVGTEKTKEFYKAWLANHTRKIDVDSLKKWGFNSIRLPMHYNLFTPPVEKEPVKGENTWFETGFLMTDELLKWCAENEMYLILDMHATPGGQGHDLNISDRDPSKPSLWESKENQQKLIALWQKLAKRYSTEPWIGAYDIINEPNWAFTDDGTLEGVLKNGVAEKDNTPLRKLMMEITEAIRKEDKTHIVIIEGNGWGNNYAGVMPPWDDNMVISFHKYWNYNDEGSIEAVLDMRKKYNTPIWLGESGENSNVWFQQAITLMETNNIGWCWWPLKKLGSNNPLEVKVNPGYENILEYWRGNVSKPDPEVAFSAIMQLAENTRFENNIIHYDVIDAMIRQPHTTETRPFKKHVLANSLVIAAVDYDLGRMGEAYFDTDAANYHVSTGKDRTQWNNGRAYRNDGVDIYADSDGYYTADIVTGEWLQYTVEVKEDGMYALAALLQTAEKTNLRITAADQSVSATVPDTFGQWKNLDLGTLELKKGLLPLRIYFDNGNSKLKEITLKRP